MAFAKALDTLGVQWNKLLPIPKFDSSHYPEVKKLIDAGVNREQYHFRLDDSQMASIFHGSTPANDGSQLFTLSEPRVNFPVSEATGQTEVFSGGLGPEMQALADALKEAKKKIITSDDHMRIKK